MTNRREAFQSFGIQESRGKRGCTYWLPLSSAAVYTELISIFLRFASFSSSGSSWSFRGRSLTDKIDVRY